MGDNQMAYSKEARQQLTGKLTPRGVIGFLKKDNWTHQITRGARQVYIKGDRRVTIHVHSKPYDSISLVENILEKQIGWTEDDLIRLKILKGKNFKKRKMTATVNGHSTGDPN